MKMKKTSKRRVANQQIIADDKAVNETELS
mgnify:CR=1 FL=1